jgi:WD40 repeat protein
VEGGAVVPLVDIDNFAGASWGEDGNIIFSTAFGKGLLRLRSGGGTPETILTPIKPERFLVVPQILPGGKSILFVSATGAEEDTNNIEVMTLADHHRKIVARGGNSARYLPTSIARPEGMGHLVYVNNATLFAIPFDVDKLETRGTAVPVLDDVAISNATSAGQFDFSSAPSGHGTLVYRRASGRAPVTLQWVDATGQPSGKTEPLRAKPGAYGGFLSLSPDGKRVALSVVEGGRSDIWVYDPQRDAMTRLTSGPRSNSVPRRSPDGQTIVLSSFLSGVFQVRADGASPPQALTQSRGRSFRRLSRRMANG